MNADVERVVEQLVAEQEIREVIHRRARGTDTRNRELCIACYHDDATEDHEGFDGPIEHYLDNASPVFQDPSPVLGCFHLVGNIEIDLDGDAADVSTYFLCTISALRDGGEHSFLNAGRYLDTFHRRDKRWAISRRRCVYEWSQRWEPSAPWLTP